MSLKTHTPCATCGTGTLNGHSGSNVVFLRSGGALGLSSLFLLMNKISQIVNTFIQRIIHTNQNVLIEEYQYVVDAYGIIRFYEIEDCVED